MKNKINTFKRQEELLDALCSNIVRQLTLAIKEKNKATLLVSGGSTPLKLFNKLSLVNIAWDKVSVGLCDERWIDSKNEDSNERLVKEKLLINYANKAKFIGMYDENKSASECEKSCEKRIKEKLFPFDVLVLGMGSDGHTASIFPNNSKTKEALDLENKNLCISMTPSTASYTRMSLTRSAILSANNVYLHFEGKEKINVFNNVKDSKDIEKFPISGILNQDLKSIKVYCDE